MTESIRPSLETVRDLSRSYRHIPTYMEISGDLETPARLLKNLRQKNPDCFILESMDGGEKWDRYSIVGYDPGTGDQRP